MINYELFFNYFSVVCCGFLDEGKTFYSHVPFKKKIQLSSVLHFHFKICGYGASRKTNKYKSKAKSLPYVLWTHIINRQHKVHFIVQGNVFHYCAFDNKFILDTWCAREKHYARCTLTVLTVISSCNRPFVTTTHQYLLTSVCSWALAMWLQLLALAPSAL